MRLERLITQLHYLQSVHHDLDHCYQGSRIWLYDGAELLF